MCHQYHLGVCRGDVAPYVLLPGDPERVPAIAQLWDEARHIATRREYVTYTGSYKGVPITCTSTGIGTPSASIALEELARCGASMFLRVGTAGTFQDNVQNGDIVIIDAAMRLDGASRLYAPIEYPAVASHDVVEAAVRAAEKLSIRYHIGITRTADTFYAGHPRPGSSYGGYWQSWWREHFDDLARLNVVAAEMEASIVLLLARVWGLRAGALAVVLDNIRHVSGESGVFEPETQLEHASDHVSRLALLACETVREIATSHPSNNRRRPEGGGASAADGELTAHEARG